MKNPFKKLLYLFVFAVTFSVHADSFDDFFRAVRADNASGVKSLLNRGFDPNTRDAQGQTGLLIALREPSPKVIQVLIDWPKTDVEARNSKDESPLMLAAIKGQQDIVTKLIDRDADINKPGWTPLHYAATNGHVAIMKQLLDKDAFIDAQSPNGTTPLMMAAMYGSAAAVKLLLDEGADPLMKNQLGMTAADFAQRANRTDALQMISEATRAKRPSDGKW
ncbi:MAG: ankyrin repeat domain-containing protein [Variovorax sp.]|nr:ankyrin repeat domain-containing protein [Variovorax sp.]